MVCALGTSGTIMGISTFLKEKNPKIKVVAAHPQKGHYIQGLKDMREAIVPAIYDPSRIDTTVMVESETSIHMVHKCRPPPVLSRTRTHTKSTVHTLCSAVLTAANPSLLCAKSINFK